MIPFEDVYKITDTCSHETAFRKDQCEVLYNILQFLPDYSEIAEVGVQFGRSLSVMGLVGKEKHFFVTGIDNWQEAESNAAQVNVQRVVHENDLPVKFINEDSKTAHSHFRDNTLDLLHIDGDHSYEGVTADCNNFIPKVRDGGYVLFHDYGQDSLPDVFRAINDYRDKNQTTLVYIGNVYTLGIFRKNYGNTQSKTS